MGRMVKIRQPTFEWHFLLGQVKGSIPDRNDNTRVAGKDPESFKQLPLKTVAAPP